jgi:hypothetical protein
MSQMYARILLKAIRRVMQFRVREPNLQATLLVMVAPFMSAQSLLDAAETSGVGRRALYRAVDELHDVTINVALRRYGLSRLIPHLKRLRDGDSSVKSRKCITLCGDDFTRAVRGAMGGLAHGCYSGADKAVVYGLRVEALIAVIGENQETIVLDARVIPPRKNRGRRRQSPAEWMMNAIERLDRSLSGHGVSLSECYLSVDSAYAAGWFVERAEVLGLQMVSELRAGLTVWSSFWSPVPAGLYFALYWFAQQFDFQPLSGDPGVEWHRHYVDTRAYGKVLVITLKIGGDLKHLFTRSPRMHTVTARRIARRRWQLERVFWNLKQLLGYTAIHQQSRQRVLVRVYLAFFLAQAASDSARELKTTVNKLHKILRRTPDVVIQEVASLCHSVRSHDPLTADDAGMAA